MNHQMLTGGRALRAPLLLTLAALAIPLWPAAVSALEYDRAQIAAGELWRIATCHWTHWSTDHLLLDALILALVGTAYALRGGRRFASCVAAAALIIPIVLWILIPEMGRYRGLSGIDSALTVALAITMLREDRVPGRPLTLVGPAAALAGLALKVGYELINGHAIFVDSVADGFVPIPLAHLIGGLVGVIVSLLPSSSPRTCRSASTGTR